MLTLSLLDFPVTRPLPVCLAVAMGSHLPSFKIHLLLLHNVGQVLWGEPEKAGIWSWITTTTGVERDDHAERDDIEENEEVEQIHYEDLFGIFELNPLDWEIGHSYLSLGPFWPVSSFVGGFVLGCMMNRQ